MTEATTVAEITNQKPATLLKAAEPKAIRHDSEKWLKFFLNNKQIAFIRDFRFACPGWPFIHPRAAEPTRLCSSHHRPGPNASPQPALTCRGLEVRASRGFLRHRSSFVSSLCQAGVLALAARQPAGTGSAQIRWSIAPNRRRVR